MSNENIKFCHIKLNEKYEVSSDICIRFLFQILYMLQPRNGELVFNITLELEYNRDENENRTFIEADCGLNTNADDGFTTPYCQRPCGSSILSEIKCDNIEIAAINFLANLNDMETSYMSNSI